MKEFIEKLIGRLEEEVKYQEQKEEEAHLDGEEVSISMARQAMGNCYNHAIEIVNQLAEEYNNGWIPCSERLPENISTVLVQVKEFESPTIGWYGNMVGWRLSEKDFDELNDFTVIAWQPLPQPFVRKDD